MLLQRLHLHPQNPAQATCYRIEDILPNQYRVVPHLSTYVLRALVGIGAGQPGGILCFLVRLNMSVLGVQASCDVAVGVPGESCGSQGR